MLLVGFLEINIEMDVAGDLVILWISRLQFIPTLNPLGLSENIRRQLDMAQKRFLIPAIVNVHANFCTLPKDVTVNVWSVRDFFSI